MDPMDRIHVEGDSTYMLMLEAARRGYPCWFCVPQQLRAEGGQARAVCQPILARPTAPHFEIGALEDRPLGDFDVVWMRKDPPFDIDYIFSTYLLDLAPPSTLVLNRPASLRDFNEKMATFRWPELCVDTLVTQDIERAVAWARSQADRVVLKPWDGNGGRGVLVSHPDDGNLRSMVEILSNEGRRAIILQRYIPEIRNGDKRIILIEGEPVGWMLRVPQPGDHRGNMHVGARVEATELTQREREICATLAPTMRRAGLLFVGIDVIGDYLTEVNVTSPTGIQEINRLMGLQLERRVTDAVEARLAALRQEVG
ncbi:MAG: glutathione synthase [Deltaproteobacteria bacterium]|nr:MAG: glutathione synthase [Deltaproteobacteria bacterium]